MSDQPYLIQYFPQPPMTGQGTCGSGCCDNSNNGCSGGRGTCGGCLPQRDIDAVFTQLQQQGDGQRQYTFYKASYESKKEIDQAIDVFNVIMEESQEKIRAQNVNEMFVYLAKYAPLTAVNNRLVYIQNTPAASHIEHAVKAFFAEQSKSN